MKNLNGAFVLVLHGHIPYVVAHGKWPHGTDWLSEAAAETYLPFLRMLRELEQENIGTRITVGITPILAEQLADPVFHAELSSYLDMKLRAAEDDRRYFRSIGEEHMAHLADRWVAFYTENRDDFENRYRKRILDAYRDYLDKGTLDIITCGATHGYFPLLGTDASINLQVKTAVETHRRHFGKKPSGIWMPECAYRPGYAWKRPVADGYPLEAYDRHGIEEFLAEHGIEYTFIDAHLLRGGKAIGAYANRFEGLRLLVQQMKKEHKFEAHENLSPYTLYNLQPQRRHDKNVTLFTRDPQTGLQVWSGEHGYPGDGWYMDFHKKRFPGGLRYWRVTAAKCSLGDKEVYNPGEVENRLEENASHYVDLIHKLLAEHKNAAGAPGVLTAPYDAELFGHWWFEGIRFIKKVYQKLNGSSSVSVATAAEAVRRHKPAITISIPEGSWGEGGFHYIWLNEHTDWTWKDLYRDELAALELVKKARASESGEFRELVTQIIRELLMAEASDWQFLISTFSARDYAEMRFSHHHRAFCRLAAAAGRFLKSNSISREDRFLLDELKKQDHPFQNLSFEWYGDLPAEPPDQATGKTAGAV